MALTRCGSYCNVVKSVRNFSHLRVVVAGVNCNVSKQNYWMIRRQMSEMQFPPKVTDHVAETPQLPTDELLPTNGEFMLEEPLQETVSSPQESGVELFSDYGLGGYVWPSEWVQNLMEVLHSNIGLPWIGTIMTTCVILRTIAIPFYAKMQAFNVRTHNCMPEQMKLQIEMAQCQSLFEKQRKSKELMEFMQRNKTNPLTQLPYMLPTSVIFMSFFAAARKMAQVKLPSLTSGGALWFTDLTVADPYCILPILTGVSLHLLIRAGGALAEGGPMAENPAFRNLFLYGFPIVTIPLVAFQPSALSIFWLTSNTYSFFLASAFRRQAVKDYFEVPARKEYSPSQRLHMMKEQQETMMRAMSKVKHHNAQMKRFAEESKRIQQKKR